MHITTNTKRNTNLLDGPLLSVDKLSLSFRRYTSTFIKGYTRPIVDLSLTVKAGEIMALVGSSGSGKSLLAHAILGILPDNAELSGELYYEGQVLNEKRQRELCGAELAFIPQSLTYLDPLMKVGKQVEGFVKHQLERREVKLWRKELFERLGLHSDVAALYPFQLSGGMARRILFSSALQGQPRLIIADEPTPGMPLEQAKAALELLREAAEQGAAVLLITHDLDLAMSFANKISVFYAGYTLEQATADDFKRGPESLRHPYTKALWRALPQHDFLPLAGYQADPDTLEGGCPFIARCSLSTAECKSDKLELREFRAGLVRCIHAT